jgi:c-di-GMP-binding flagellar brake protein YcgR
MESNMNGNILRHGDITKMYLIYITPQTLKKKVEVKLRFSEKEEIYLTSSIPVNFTKPKERSSAEIIVYTTDGVYKTDVQLFDANIVLNDVMYKLKTPKSWNYIQLRNSSRKRIPLNGTLKYNDGKEITFETYDVALGGVSFYMNAQIQNIYQQLPGTVTINLPKEASGAKIETEGRIIRSKFGEEEYLGQVFYVIRFASLTNEQIILLKQFLMSIE